MLGASPASQAASRIDGRNSCRLKLLSSDSLENQLRFGVDYALMRNLRFSLGWQIFDRAYSDPQYSQYNYKVSTLLAEVGFRF